MHMATHPEWNWGIILQQAWALCIKNPIRQARTGGRQDNDGGNNKHQENKKVCFQYNRGKCTYGYRCKFDHCCGIFGKRGHGAFNCKRAIDDKSREGNRYHRNNGRNNEQQRHHQRK